jgi:hypothetical protein
MNVDAPAAAALWRRVDGLGAAFSRSKERPFAATDPTDSQPMRHGPFGEPVDRVSVSGDAQPTAKPGASAPDHRRALTDQPTLTRR